MKRVLIDLADGVLTGLVTGVAGLAVSRWRGVALPDAASGLFVAGALVAFLAMLWAAFHRPSPPGFLRRWPRPPAEPVRHRQIWLDRAVSTANLWLSAGVAMIALSFLVLLLP